MNKHGIKAVVIFWSIILGLGLYIITILGLSQYFHSPIPFVLGIVAPVVVGINCMIYAGGAADAKLKEKRNR